MKTTEEKSEKRTERTIGVIVLVVCTLGAAAGLASAPLCQTVTGAGLWFAIGFVNLILAADSAMKLIRD